MAYITASRWCGISGAALSSALVLPPTDPDWKVHHADKMGNPTHPADVHKFVRLQRGCQTRMVLGRSCEGRTMKVLDWDPTAAEMEEAIRLVHSDVFR